MGGFIASLLSIVSCVAAWLGGGASFPSWTYKADAIRVVPGRRHHLLSTFPFPLESIFPAQAGVALPHLVPLAPNVGQFVRPLAGGALVLQLLVEGALLLQVVAPGAERAHASLPVDLHAYGTALRAHRLHGE